MSNRRENVAREIARKHNKELIVSETTKICPNLNCVSHIKKDYRFLQLSTYYIKICVYCDSHVFWDLQKGQKQL